MAGPSALRTVATMNVAFYATHQHYRDHLAPIAAAFGVPVSDHVPAGTGPVVVASNGNLADARATGRPLVLLNHGAGQTYNVNHPSYAGGGGHNDVALFLEPGPHAATATRRTNPHARVVEVGCPKLDARHTAPPKPRGPRPVVAVTFHWRCRVCPETDTAFDHYRDALTDLVAGPWTVLGHGHPLMLNELRPVWDSLGVETVDCLDDVFDRADVLVGDNTSALYEFASLNRPVVCVNAPRYRRNVHHGLRFWDAVPGVQCDQPGDLTAAVAAALDDPDEYRQLRAHAVSRAYTACDGNGTRRAVDAIRCLAGDMNTGPVTVTSPFGSFTVPADGWRLMTGGVVARSPDGHVAVVSRAHYATQLQALAWRELGVIEPLST